MMHVSFMVPGKPVSWSRANLWKGRLLTPKSMRIAKENVATLGRLAMIKYSARCTPRPVAVELEFYGARATSDIDNLSKLILDALNGIAWDDDKQVMYLRAGKSTAAGIPPCTVILIRLLESLP